MRLQIVARLAPIALLAVPAGPAHAAEVGANRETDLDPAGVSIVDQRGARNDLAVEAEPGRLVVRERGPDALRVRGTCRRRSPRVAVCPSFGADVDVVLGRGDDRLAYRRSDSGEEVVSIDGGRGDDEVTMTGTGAVVDGAEGRDALRGGSGPDRLFGGPGSDVLRGGAASDVLDGDGWYDDGAPRAGEPAPRQTVNADVLDGGPGRDLASWAARRRPVLVDLAAGGRGGAAGEGDRLRSIEGAVGGRRGDRLLGDQHANVLHGGPGADLLVGRAGNDLLGAGTFRPGYTGGPDRATDRIRCGPGRDRVSDPALDPLVRDCERIAESDEDAFTLGGLPLDVLRPAGRRRVRVEVFAPVDVAAGRSHRRVTLRHGGRVLGRSRRVRVTAERSAIAVRLRRALPRRGIVRVVIEASDKVENEAPERSRFVYRIRR